MNPFEVGHGKIDVQSHSMETDSLPDSQANTAKLFVTDPDTSIPGISRSLDAERFGNAEHDFFEHEDQFRDAESLTIQIQDGIDHHLAGAVIGDVPPLST